MSRKTGSITLYTNMINWEPYYLAGARGYAWSKTLSKDVETGGPLLIKYEARFISPAATRQCTFTRGSRNSSSRATTRTTTPTSTDIGDGFRAPTCVVNRYLSAWRRSPKLDDNYYMIVRSGWTPDPDKPTAWRAQQDVTEVPLPGTIDFQE